MSLTVKEVLLAAADLCEKGWVRGTFAVNEFGVMVDPDDDEACRFCVIGAIYRVAHVRRTDSRDAEHCRLAADACKAAQRRVPKHDYLYQWNDAPERTQAEVVAALRAAAAAQETP